MLRTLRSRRRPRYGAPLCAAVSALLLLLSVTVLHSRLGFDRRSPTTLLSNDLSFETNPLLDDAVSESTSDDRIDELDVVEEDQDSDPSKASNEEEILRGVEFEDEDESDQSKASGFYFDHVLGVIRRPFDKRSIDKWEDYASFDVGFGVEDRSKGVFASDDVAVDEEVRRKVAEVNGVEDALLLKTGRRVNPLREGWGLWFDKKGDFLRRDKMFKSNVELLNPLHNPMLQDPDGSGVTGLTRGDKLVQKFLMSEFKKVPFGVRHNSILEDHGVGIKKSTVSNTEANEGFESIVEKRRSDIKRAERRTLDDNANSSGSSSWKGVDANHTYDLSTDYRNLSYRGNGKEGEKDQNQGNSGGGELSESDRLKNVGSKAQSSSELSGHISADGKRWGYFPGLHSHLSFSDFMDAFFRRDMCDMRVFMVRNSPPWMYTVRYQRGLESLLYHHRDACVVVFSETIELDFFKDFVNDGFKVAVAMPNLDELLRDTPVHVFSSVWFEWRKTKFYSTHYSELVRLAALYKYGGIYLDSDIIVLNPLSSLNYSVGLESQLVGGPLNGAVMAFRKHRWNGADLLTRVARNFLDKENIYDKQMELKVQPSFIFFPINRNNITRYFTSPATESERAEQEALFKKILNESLTFHFWSSITSTLVPEPMSLVARLIDRSCIRCLDVM
ncbi:uncharacterized protein At4g19900 isoform X2 [Malania oleifera]|uniref:uncharacterized protein At4g19900 isoform X2 n=1 Tax=Malania oleifera TaxID=397392 RepID=UPI0025AEA2CD|nr:uncharacterized protein At4g19900 isoform X2 [Malania oleifera]